MPREGQSGGRGGLLMKSMLSRKCSVLSLNQLDPGGAVPPGSAGPRDVRASEAENKET